MKDYFLYLPPSPQAGLWGAEVTALGFTKVPCGGAYPPARHPDDHHFSWRRGRVLQTYQIVFISEGEGVLEVKAPGHSRRVEAGRVFILFPGVWHRYAPDPAQGWTEHWLEGRGRVFDEALARGLISPAQPVIDLGRAAAVMEIFQHCHDYATQGFQEGLATLGLHLLSLVIQARARGETGARRILALRLERARRILIERCDHPLDVEEVATAVGLGYSHFRQAFRRECGMGPREFHAQARLRRACDLLANTELSVKEIAEMLGFSSAFHFSVSFKRAKGVAPSQWR